MKKVLFSLLVVLLFVKSAGAQSLQLGIKAGADLDKVQGQSFKNGFYLGYYVGGFLNIGISKTIGIQPEVLFQQTNTKYSNGGGDFIGNLANGDNIQLNYLNIPIMLNITPIKVLTLQAGPEYGILMSNHQTVLQNGEDAFKNGDFAVGFGAQLNLGALKVTGRYNIGVSNISNISNSGTWQSQQLQIGVGLVL